MNKDKKKNKGDKEKKNKQLGDETKKGILAIVFFVLAIIAILSRFNLAGAVGSYLYQTVEALFGLGFYLFPFGLILAGVALLRALRQDLMGLPMIGVGVFLASFLGVLELLFQGGEEAVRAGGWIGYGFLWPFERAFGVYAAFVILSALLIIGVLVAFNLSFSVFLLKLFGLMNGRKTEGENEQAKAGEAGQRPKVEFVVDVEKIREKRSLWSRIQL